MTIISIALICNLKWRMCWILLISFRLYSLRQDLTTNIAQENADWSNHNAVAGQELQWQASGSTSLRTDPKKSVSLSRIFTITITYM
jgi:hypothetical protein